MFPRIAHHEYYLSFHRSEALADEDVLVVVYNLNEVGWRGCWASTYVLEQCLDHEIKKIIMIMDISTPLGAIIVTQTVRYIIKQRAMIPTIF